jgi:hypothetical protein
MKTNGIFADLNGFKTMGMGGLALKRFFGMEVGLEGWKGRGRRRWIGDVYGEGQKRISDRICVKIARRGIQKIQMFT